MQQIDQMAQLRPRRFLRVRQLDPAMDAHALPVVIGFTAYRALSLRHLAAVVRQMVLGYVLHGRSFLSEHIETSLPYGRIVSSILHAEGPSDMRSEEHTSELQS